MLKVLFVTGYKNYELGIFDNKSKEVSFIKKAMYNRLNILAEEGLEWVLISGQMGVELWAGEAVISLKKTYRDLKLAVLTPFLNQESKWNEKNQEYYNYIIENADYVDSISKQPYVNPGQFKNRDQLLLHKSDGILILYDEEKEGSAKYIWQEAKKYKEKKPYEIIQIDFYDLQQLIEEASMEHNNK